MLKNRSLNIKILSGFCIVCIGLAIVAVTSYIGLQQVVKVYNQLAKISVPNLGHISGMRARGRQIHAETTKLALFWDQPNETNKTLESLAHAVKRYEGITSDYLKEKFSPGEEEIYKEIDAAYQPMKISMNKVLDLFNSQETDKLAKMKTVLLEFEEQVRTHQTSLLKLDDYHVALGEKWATESQTLSTNTRMFLAVVAFITFTAGVCIAIFLSRSINNLLRQLAERLVESSEKVASNSSLVSQASQDLAHGTTEQAESLHETVASTNEIAAMTEKTSDNCRESLKRAEQSREASSKGQHSLDMMLKAIGEIASSNKNINDQIKNGNAEIQEIVNLILQIGEKTKLIDDIVFQTKLLSFNVSVEAARAGEHGKGFAVVAEEMSNLAGMSGRASKEISTMLSETTQKAQKVVESNQTNVNRLLVVGESKVQDGYHVASECKTVLEEILHYVEEMCSMIRETTMSTEEQSRGVAEINKAMGALDTITSQNANSSQQCSEAANCLMVEVDKTRDVVQDLFQAIHGKTVDQPQVVHNHAPSNVKAIKKKQTKHHAA
jgi:methyl-accepting chemotaxis protein